MAGGDGKGGDGRKPSARNPRATTPTKAAEPPKKRAPRKVTHRKAPAKTATKVARNSRATPTAADRAKAAEQIATVTSIKAAGAPSRRGRIPGTRQNRKGPDSPMSPEAIRLTERRRQALNYRRLGLTWGQVAEQIRAEYEQDVPRYTAADAYKDAKTLLDAVTVEAVQGIREEDLALLLSLQRAAYPKALDGDWKAMDRMLKILDQRARYLGLYAPTRHELTGPSGAAVPLEMADPREVFEAAYSVLDGLLPAIEHAAPELPAGPS